MTQASASVLGVYCERGFDPSFWAEPVNALTNAAFVVAGVAARAKARDDAGIAVLAAVTIAIGVGSFLFHTFATRWALVADVAPIQAFIAIYFFLAMRRFVGLGPFAGAAATVAFMALAALLPRLLPGHEPWGGLGGYLGGLSGLVGVGAALLGGNKEKRRIGLALLGVSALFALSLVLRSIDHAVCEVVAFGAHPAWHLLNSLVLFTLMAILGREPPRIRRDDAIG